MTTPGGGGLVGDATIRITADTDPAILALAGLTRDANGRLRDLQGRFVTTGQTINRTLTNVGPVRIDVDTDEANASINRLVGSLGAVTPALAGLGGIGAALGTATPAIAGVAAAVQNILPAAAAATTGIAAVGLVAGTVRLAMVGVGDAITNAFATGEGSTKAFRESIAGLAPSARALAVEVRGMREEFTAVQQGVQQRFFEGFAGELRQLSNTVLPIFENQLNASAGTLNQMALRTSDAASQLARDGTLGRALRGANEGLFNLRDVPAQVLTAFFQLADAGAPTFNRLTEAASNAATNISERLSEAAESGALENAVNEAADILASLAPIASDAFGIIGNLIEATSVEGGDLFQVIGSIFDALNQFTGSSAFQNAIGALTETMGVVAETVAPLLIAALEAIAPIFVELAEPVQQIIQALGEGLAPIIEALGPVLLSVAGAIGSILTAISPLLPVLGELIAQLAESLTPIFEALAAQFVLFAPLISQVAELLGNVLQPILAVLPSVIEPILQAFLRLIQEALPILAQLLVELEPTLIELAILLADLLVALTPLIVAVIDLATWVLNLLMPAISGLIGFIGDLAGILGDVLSAHIRNIVIPAINALTALLSGDFSGAFRSARTLVSNVLGAIGGFFQSLGTTVFGAMADVVGAVGGGVLDVLRFFQGVPNRVGGALASLGQRLFNIMTDAVGRMLGAARTKIGEIVDFVRELPQRAASALGDLGNVLYSAGRALVQGFIDGMLSLVSEVSNAASGLINSVTGWFPDSPAERGPLSGSGYVLLRGQRFTEDFARGLEMPQRLVEQASRKLAGSSVAGFEGARAPGLLLSSTADVGGAATVADPVQLIVNFTNQGVIGSRAEVMDWLTRALDQLSRQNRLPQNRNRLRSGGNP